ncbi:MAG: hypothetical protein OWV35_05010, partial [Firmicutes bacterium]|nr:hypothetical protein [Bacillota bacterium]
AGTPAAILPAPLEPQEAEDVRADQVVRILQLLRQHYSYVIIDTAPGYTEVNVAALDFADLILLVCMPDVVTLRTVSQALRLFLEGFRYPKEKVRVVLNRAGSHTGVEAPEIAAALGTPVDYLLPSDGAWPVKASNQGRPLVLLEPHSLFAEAIGDLARDLTGRGDNPAPAVPVPEPRKPWWQLGRRAAKAPDGSAPGMGR